MYRVLALTSAIASAGCSAVFGLDSPTRAADASITGDDTLVPDDAAPADAPIDVAPVTDLARIVDITDAQVVGGPHANFPVLISTVQTWLRTTTKGGDVQRADGFDIYFSADEAGISRLAFELAYYDGNNGELAAWVNVPSLAASSSFYIHYGSSAITTSQQNVAGTWANGYELVMHLGGTTDASGTVTGITATNVGTGTGQVSTASTFDGTTSVIDATSTAALDNLFVDGGTAAIWIRPTNAGENNLGRMFDKGGAVGWAFFTDNLSAPSTISFAHGTGGSTEAIWRAPASSLSFNAWHHVAVVFDKDSQANAPGFYIDGAAVNTNVTSAADGAFASDASFSLRLGNSEAGDRTFNGSLDEARLSSVPRSAGWLATEYRNQSSPGTFLSFGAEL